MVEGDQAVTNRHEILQLLSQWGHSLPPFSVGGVSGYELASVWKCWGPINGHDRSIVRRENVESCSMRLEASDAVSDRVFGQVGRRMKVQLLHDTGLMELHRFHRHAEDRGDLLRAPPLGDKLQDFPLPRGERRRRHQLASLPGGGLEDRFQYIFRNERCQVVVTSQHCRDRLAEFGGCGAFQEIPGGTGLEGFRRIGRTRMHGEKDQFALRYELRELPGRIEPVQERHGDVQENQVRPQFLRHVNQRAPVFSTVATTS